MQTQHQIAFNFRYLSVEEELPADEIRERDVATASVAIKSITLDQSPVPDCKCSETYHIAVCTAKLEKKCLLLRKYI